MLKTILSHSVCGKEYSTALLDGAGSVSQMLLSPKGLTWLGGSWGAHVLGCPEASLPCGSFFIQLLVCVCPRFSDPREGGGSPMSYVLVSQVTHQPFCIFYSSEAGNLEEPTFKRRRIKFRLLKGRVSKNLCTYFRITNGCLNF